MRLPRTIGFKITLGFGLLIMAIIIYAVLSNRNITRMKTAEEEVVSVLEPSIRYLIELQNLVEKSDLLIRGWDHSGRSTESQELKALTSIIERDLPETNAKIRQLSDNWLERDILAYTGLYRNISDSLSSFLSSPRIYFSGTSADFGYSDYIYQTLELSDNQLDSLIHRFDRLVLQASRISLDTYRKASQFLLFAGILISLAAILIAILLFYSLVKPIKQYRYTITSMGKGVVPDREFREGSDEMGQIGAALNKMIGGLKNLSEFAEEIGKGNFNSSFIPQSEDDILGNSLIRLREDLMNAAIEEDKRKEEDERRNWSNNGLTRFSEILREHTGVQQSLCNKLISELVKYLEAQVGGIFLIREDEKGKQTIELEASWAYDRSKHLKKTIMPGEGLVGRCVQEGSTIYITDVPDDYIRVKSGLGTDKPKSLLIVPVRLNEIIIGVIELASLMLIMDFQIEFVERIATTIASSLTGKNKKI